MSDEAPRPLQGLRILSLCLNLPGPAALWRCVSMGASCHKIEPLTSDGRSSDPMAMYCPEAYAQMHDGVQVVQLDLKTPQGQRSLHEQLAHTDILLTSFRPTALNKLGLAWEDLQTFYPKLSMVRIFGSADQFADMPGHDLTYQAEAGLITSTTLPPSLFADMTGALMASEAVLQAPLVSLRTGRGIVRDIGLAQAAQWQALPWTWGLTQPLGDVGGAHAGYSIYPCSDGIVAVAALEPHFAQRLCAVAGMSFTHHEDMRRQEVHRGIAIFFAAHNCAQLSQLAKEKDIPLYAMTRG